MFPSVVKTWPLKIHESPIFKYDVPIQMPMYIAIFDSGMVHLDP